MTRDIALKLVFRVEILQMAYAASPEEAQRVIVEALGKMSNGILNAKNLVEVEEIEPPC